MGRFGACVVLLAALLTSGAAAQDLTDGEVLIVPEGWEVEAAPPVVADERPGPDGGYLYIDEADAAADSTGEKSTVLKKKLARWKDPFTLPKSRVSCSKWAKPWPGSKICVGHKVQWRWMYCDVSLVVSGPDVSGAKQAFEECLRTGAVVAAAAGIVAAAGTAGAGLPAAKAAFVTTFKACLAARVGGAALGVDLPQSCGWGPWQ